ncbi:MAG: agmatinase [Rhodospirillaceae bacterium]|nr:agmatinase [Rhodospirillaceae bacterium]MBT3911379.1 agmatinase [Rhodospirillaceae bacterium]MBT5297430.1 agmatinase [Rhodospirillaceae bacterium]MBT5513748.1 agmatinase [Rhodospirillaceae bacterium]MBT6086657.1 agmatinase [Rhodospirillaceae bacterium]
MSNIFDDRLFKPPGTFMGLDYGHDLNGRKAAVLGVPYDNGTHGHRVGARDGPRAIREASRLIRRFRPPDADFDPLERLGVIDCGDVKVVPSMLADAEASIQEAVNLIAGAGAVPLTMGGDGSVTIGQLRAMAGHHPDLVVLHVDSHTDANPGDDRPKATGNTFVRAAEEGLVDTDVSIHVGMRGTFYNPGIFEKARDLGYGLMTYEEIRTRGVDEITSDLKQRLAGRPVYLCWDMDFFDPSCAPGVCAPIPGGPSAEEGLRLLRGLSGLNFVAFDVNTVSPPHDVQGITAQLAAQVMYNCLILLCENPKQI